MGWVIVTDTLCEGWQAWGEQSGDVEVYETEADAQAEIDYDFDDLRRNQIESGMEPDQEPDAFAIPINEYTRGRKAVWARKN
jgi:hypothetical protein